MGDITEDVTKMWERFTLLEEESVGIQTHEGDFEPLVGRGSSCVVGKLLADRTVGKEVIKTPLIRAWQPQKRVSFKNVGNNMFLIDFEEEVDKIRVMEGRPWTFDGDLVSLADFDGMTPPTALEFEKAAFWVRMYDLPLACMSREMGMRIGSSVGEVEEVEVDEDGVGWGEYLRVRIVLDLSKPISRGRILHVRDKQYWITFKYEKLPRFCFKCGTIRHGSKGCIAPSGQKRQGQNDDAQFGPWLRVTTGGNRRFRPGENRRDNGWKRQDSVPQTTALVNGGEAQPDGEGWKTVDHGGTSTEAGRERSKINNGKISQARKEQQQINSSGSLGDLSAKEKENISSDFGESEYGDGGRIKDCENLGSYKSGHNELEDSAINSSSMKSKGNKERSIYVGQWDAIKEKMVWASLEKGGEVAGQSGNFWAKEYVENFRMPYGDCGRGKGKDVAADMIMQPNSSPTMKSRGLGGKITGRDQQLGDRDRETEGKRALAGKRKEGGSQAEGGRREGKRYRLVDENDDAWSENEAAAAMQPRRTQ
jgi:hypothetical protein